MKRNQQFDCFNESSGAMSAGMSDPNGSADEDNGQQNLIEDKVS